MQPTVGYFYYKLYSANLNWAAQSLDWATSRPAAAGWT